MSNRLVGSKTGNERDGCEEEENGAEENGDGA